MINDGLLEKVSALDVLTAESAEAQRASYDANEEWVVAIRARARVERKLEAARGELLALVERANRIAVDAPEVAVLRNQIRCRAVAEAEQRVKDLEVQLGQAFAEEHVALEAKTSAGARMLAAEAALKAEQARRERLVHRALRSLGLEQ